MSPVIGAILMVAITVILAAAIGAFVLDMGGAATDSGPQASLAVTADAGSNLITVTHRGGDGIQATRTRLVVTAEATGDRLAFDPASNASVLRVGGIVTIDVPAGNVTSPTWGDLAPSTTDAFAIEPGGRYTLQVIDAAGQRVIFETTVTA